MKEKLEQKKSEWWQERDIFLFAALAGLLSHAYMMTNKFPNVDDYVSMFHYGQGYALGRWLLALMGNFMFRIDGTYSLPFFNGMLYLCTLVLSITIFLKPFSFKSKWTKRILAALFVSFPTATATMGFMFTAPFYGLAVLFMAIAFYLLVQYKYGFIFSALLACCSLGIYQAYWGLLAGFLLLYLITLCVQKECSYRDIITLALKSLIALLAGVIFYLIINNIMLHLQGVEMVQYQGASQMGLFDLSRIPLILKNAYGYFFAFTTENYLFVTWYPLVRMVIAIGYLLTLCTLLFTCLSKQLHVLKKVGCAIFILVFPLAVNSIYLLCNDATSVHTLMCYSVVLVFFIPFVMLRGAMNNTSRDILFRTAKSLYLAAVLLVTVIYVRFANIYYLNLQLAYEESYSFMETLSTRIQDTEGYDDEFPILFYGTYDQKVNRNIWELRMVNNMFGTIDVNDIINHYLIRQGFSRIYLGNQFNETFDMSVINNHPVEIKQMPCYPNDGSIRIMDEVIVIKFSEP
ncbi:MAG: glucosyltransferase domain-containing protein [Lachnospiraceae bacterium]|nr:glucosyltransferase domain-containing protein [Lachnospiraceae bacterium]